MVPQSVGIAEALACMSKSSEEPLSRPQVTAPIRTKAVASAAVTRRVKRLAVALAVLLAISGLGGIFIFAQTTNAPASPTPAEAPVEFVCPMHPDVRSL